MENLKTLRKRLLYQSQHRGLREMDFLLGRFAQQYIGEMAREDLTQFEELLTFPDQQLYAWFFGKASPPSHGPLLMIQALQRYIACL